MKRRYLKTVAAAGVLFLTAVSMAGGKGNAPASKWLSGDFHQHSYYSDGSTTFDYEMLKSNEFGLDWWANSEHGGQRVQDGNNHFWDDPVAHPGLTILGNTIMSGTHRVMFRWQSLRDFAWPDILRTRLLYPDRRIASGVEWNVPGHEHCSVGIIAQDAHAVSAFEFQFDKSDADMSRVGEVTPFGTLVKRNGTTNGSTRKASGLDRHADAVAGAKWLNDQRAAGLIDDAWVVFAHIERANAFKTGSSDGGYNIEHFRDFNNNAPDVCIGFEGVPGHQQNPTGRGGFGTGASGGGTYGGAGYYVAKVGGLWDAMLGEGRRWFNFASSDYHLHWTAGGDDYYPGEYQKTWSYVNDSDNDGDYSLKEIAESLRSGNTYNTMGDLINYLDFSVQNNNEKADMGGELASRGAIKNLQIKIKFKTPRVNNFDESPRVDHIDLIAGDITGIIDPSSPSYTKATNESAKVIARFSSADWENDKEGYSTIVYHIKNVSKSTYFRLRGTNQAVNTPGQTDADGNPLLDFRSPLTGDEEARTDLWFYGNPIFVYVE